MKQYEISTRLVGQLEFNHEWTPLPELEQALEAVEDIQNLPEDYREIELTELDCDHGRKVGIWRRYDYGGEWVKVL